MRPIPTFELVFFLMLVLLAAPFAVCFVSRALKQNSVVQILPRYIQRKAKTPIADSRCLGFSYLEFFNQSRYASMVMIPAAHLSFSFRASAAHCKNCSCVHLPAAMCAKRFLYSRRYAENTSSLFFLSAHTFEAPTILHDLPLVPNGRSQ